MKTKQITVAEGELLKISSLPSFSKSGSITGMKKIYYGTDALLVRCGNYIYNVDEHTYNKI